MVHSTLDFLSEVGSLTQLTALKIEINEMTDTFILTYI